MAMSPELRREKKRAYDAAWYRDNAGKVSARKAAWYRANAENRNLVRARTIAWRRARPGYDAAWRRANVEKERARTTAWRRAHPAEIRALNALRRARQRELSPLLTSQERAEVIALYANARALTYMMGEPYHVDHIQPLAKGGLHHPKNLQVLLGVENLRKGAR